MSYSEAKECRDFEPLVYCFKILLDLIRFEFIFERSGKELIGMSLEIDSEDIWNFVILLRDCFSETEDLCPKVELK